ncbi:DNA-directed RNA polymerase, mitochondrial [Genypterus blacodes]|uniref:DNA-directed RNA polymerase, mitochondrial n=1 Tax=Genypterus blacodes TaxID=154954 RepID=UPI003F75EC53
MSLLRVCALAKCWNRRSLFEKCLRVSVTLRSGAVRRISETPLWLQRRNFAPSIPKTEDGKKRTLAQLSDVLEARIQQLQTDVVLDVQHAKVQFLKAPSSGKGLPTSRGPKNIAQEKTDIPKLEQQPSNKKAKRWMEKLTQEKNNKIKKQQNLQKYIKEKQHRKSSATPPPTEEKIAAPVPQTVSKVKGKDYSHQLGKDTTFQAKDVKDLEKRLKKLVAQTSFVKPEHLPEEDYRTRRLNEHIQLRTRTYLKACVSARNLGRAHTFLLNQHRNLRRRKLLTTNIYNIMMRVWAKKASWNNISRLFKLLEEANLKPNLGSYCAALECMGRMPNCSPPVITRCLAEMEKDGLSADDLFSQFVFRQDERDMVLKALQIVKPDYQPGPNVPTTPPSSLVQDFYNKDGHHQYPRLDFTQEELQQRFTAQLDMELNCTVTIDSVEATKPVTATMAKMRDLLAEQRAQWEKVLFDALGEARITLSKISTRELTGCNLYPFLCLLDDRDYVDIMIQSLSTMPPTGVSLSTIAIYMGNRVFTMCSVREKHCNQMVEKLANIYSSYAELLVKDTKTNNVLPREQWCNLEAERPSGPTLLGDEDHWPDFIMVQLGIYLLELMVKNLKFNSDILNPSVDRKIIPILYHMYTFRSTRQIGFIKPHPILTQMMQDATVSKLTFDSYMLPMRCPPLPWTSAKFGAYLLTPTKLMRALGGAIQHEKLLEKCQNLDPALDSLNLLGNCAWRVNKPLLDIIISMFNDRGSEKLGIPPPMSEAPAIPQVNLQDPSFTSTEKSQMKRNVVSAKNKCSEMHSMRMDALNKISIANYMRDEVFWFPHNMDFRGRVYPCPPYFNHLGSDVTRSMLIFAEGKPLGPFGLNWLKIHLVNLTGLKKQNSLQGRLDYANSIMEDILDSADNPMKGKKWWMTADEPWQTLACCMEIAKAVRSPDPEHFISHFPVHQDGSCNGLQHYAALGRDVIGATSVNLMPCDVPQDVYSGIAQQVEEFRARDAKNDVKIAQVLEGFINRKVVKQTVMTVVYGVTRYGGRRQIERRLKEIDEFPKDHVWEASSYLVRLVFSSLKEMFTATREIQDWLTDSAKLISKAGHSVEWVTPLGLPVIQPYHRTRQYVVQGKLQQTHIAVSCDHTEKPDTMKQKNAFPPNYIHSLDSTHMMLTALYCYRSGLTFASVHDCFWTHALTVDTMNKICREQFVALHEQPILQELSNFLLVKYCAEMRDEEEKKYIEYRTLLLSLGKVPKTGDFDLQQVKKSTYFFS